jgi:large subunit ribosomal protein L13
MIPAPQYADLAGRNIEREVPDRGFVLSGVALGDVPMRHRTAGRPATTTAIRPALSSAGRGRCAALFMATATAMKTYQANAQDRERDWYVVDAADRTLGRLATQIADVLRGKRKPTYTPHVDVGDFVIVVNAEKVAVTGNKREDKRYWRHSGYPGGIRSRTLGDLLEKRPEEVIRRAVKGMLPRNRLARQQLRKLKIYAGPDHPHQAQKPEELRIET